MSSTMIEIGGMDLKNAIYAGRIDLIQKLLDLGADVNGKNRTERAAEKSGFDSPLVIAIESYRTRRDVLVRVGIVNLLLDRGADINMVVGEIYGTALGAAAYRGRTEIVTILLDRGADINIVGGDYGTALGMAAYLGHAEIVTILLDRGADVNILGGTYGTALGAAAYEGEADIVVILLDRGADVNIVGGEYGTALGAAASGRAEEIVKMLLARGASINIVGGYYGTALGAATYQGKAEIVTILLDRGADINIVGGEYGTALGAATYQGKAEIVTILLDRGADINIVGGDYGTALGMAAYLGHAEIVTILLDRGADVNIVGGEYGTALATAAHTGRSGIIRVLLDRGADINRVGGEYGTALAAAACVYTPGKKGFQRDRHPGGRIETVRVLLDLGADINKVGGVYGTALAAAAYCMGNAEIVETLLIRGADVKKAAGDYGTALGACVAGDCDQDIMELLLDQGVGQHINNVHVLGSTYGTVLDLAITKACQENPGKPSAALLQQLQNKGADINVVSNQYGTPLGRAAYEGNQALIDVLLAHGADPLHVGGKYETEDGSYPSALHAATQGGNTDPGRLMWLSKIMKQLRNPNERDIDPETWPPFPMPYYGRLSPNAIPLREISSPVDIAHCLGSILQPQEPLQHRTPRLVITPGQADLFCKSIDREILVRVLVTLVGVRPEAVDRHQSCIQNDVRYFVSQDYDLGLAFAAARIGWKNFNETSLEVILIHRPRMLKSVWNHSKERREAISEDGMGGHQVIKSPYEVMPRLLWDIYSNRVVEFGMLYAHFEVCRGENNCFTEPTTRVVPPFWAITHSWTHNMESVETPINSFEWPVPLPKDLNIEKDLRRELLKLGAEYIWLDVLCLRQWSAVQHGDRNMIREEEWKIDVPTIGNIYRSATAVVRYFNGLGKPFITSGWDDSRHWLQRAWTLQEIRNENITISGGTSMIGETSKIGEHSVISSTGILMNTRGMAPGNPTLRNALRPVLRLATKVDSPNGCSIYELAREMARRHATQPTDKVSGLLYLLHITSLPTYDAARTDEDVWTSSFPLLPFARKMEILFDFPYRASMKDPTGHLLLTCPSTMTSFAPCLASIAHARAQRWFPTWAQMMSWPDRHPDYEHSLPLVPQAAGSSCFLQQPPVEFNLMSLYVTDIWALSRIHLQVSSNPDEYVVLAGATKLGFYTPYSLQCSIEIQDTKVYTVVTPYPQVSGNWAVCESKGVKTQPLKPETTNGEVKTISFEVLKKVGVLRTDSCSILFIQAQNRSDALLKKINALFI